MLKLTKEQCINLGIAYIDKHNTYPSSKKWNITTAGCSRDRIYENWPSWVDFINDLATYYTIPEISQKYRFKYSKEDVINFLKKSAESNSGIPLFRDFRDSNEYPSLETIKYHFGSWTNALIELDFKKEHILNGTYKICKKCNTLLDTSYFSKNIARKDNLQDYCKNCVSLYMKRYSYRGRDREKLIEQRTPKWANRVAIKEIYKNCPNDCHVDHIIPLNSELVCGLHVETNLQYLSVKNNIKKSNKFDGGWAR